MCRVVDGLRSSVLLFAQRGSIIVTGGVDPTNESVIFGL